MKWGFEILPYTNVVIPRGRAAGPDALLQCRDVKKIICEARGVGHKV